MTTKAQKYRAKYLKALQAIQSTATAILPDPTRVLEELGESGGIEYAVGYFGYADGTVLHVYCAWDDDKDIYYWTATAHSL